MEAIRRPLVLGLVLMAGTTIEQVPSVGLFDFDVHKKHQHDSTILIHIFITE